MTLRHMMIFKALCENGYNTTKAANQLNMTQPAVSLAIKELESYYGVALFDRIGKRLHITEAGELFLEKAVHITNMFEDMENNLKQWDEYGTVKIGASITIGSQLLPKYLKTLKELFPGIHTKVIVMPSEQLEEKIMTNEIDFALIEGAVHHSSIVSMEYMEDRLVVIASKESSFSYGQKLSISEFKEQDFLLREPGSGTREVLDHETHKAGFLVTPAWEAMSTTAIVNGVMNGLGIAVLSYRMIAGAIEKGLVIPLKVEGLDFRRNFKIIYHKDKLLTNSMKKTIELIQDYESNYPFPEYNGLF